MLPKSTQLFLDSAMNLDTEQNGVWRTGLRFHRSEKNEYKPMEVAAMHGSLGEWVTKHYEILGTIVPVELSFYHSGHVVATHVPSGKVVSTTTRPDMDRKLTMYFQNLLYRSIKKGWTAVQMPDGELMLASQTC